MGEREVLAADEGGRGLWRDGDGYGARLGGSECSGCVGWVWWVWARTSKCTDGGEKKNEVKREAEMLVSEVDGILRSWAKEDATFLCCGKA